MLKSHGIEYPAHDYDIARLVDSSSRDLSRSAIRKAYQDAFRALSAAQRRARKQNDETSSITDGVTAWLEDKDLPEDRERVARFPGGTGNRTGLRQSGRTHVTALGE